MDIDEGMVVQAVEGNHSSARLDNGIDPGSVNAGTESTETILQKLLHRVTHLEEQVAVCLKSQPCLRKVLNKSNLLERRLKEVDERLQEFARELRPLQRKIQKKPASEDLGLDTDPDPVDEQEDEDPDWCPEAPDVHIESDEDNHLEVMDVKPTQCKLCPGHSKTVFDNEEDLAKHYTSQHPVPMMMTDELDESFIPSRATTMKGSGSGSSQRAGTTDKEGPYKCEECGLGFLNKNNIYRHRHSVHEAVTHTCEICQKTFSRMDKLNLHKRNSHGIKMKRSRSGSHRPASVKIPQVVQCPEPGCKKTCQRHHLKEHMKSHTDEKGHMCELCGLSYKRSRDLIIHERIHTGERPFSCEHCEKRFRSRGTLKTHMNQHKGMPHICEVCGRGFPKLSHINAHMKNHEAGKRMRIRRKKQVELPAASGPEPGLEDVDMSPDADLPPTGSLVSNSAVIN